MAMTRRTFAQTALAAVAMTAYPIKRLGRYAILRVRYAEIPREDQYRGEIAPATPEEIAKTGEWLG